ncbi:MAG: hypothetical protein MUC96_30600 [Myxococcaceae bacterium]|jgi:hypothetical protein|nr:hypothetical protein [Myxococcaceae bacterium]
MPTRLGLLLLLTGCVGEYSSTPEELARYEWVAQVKVNPTAPVAGRQVSFNLELTSHSNTMVVVDIVLRAHRADGSLLHEQVWSGVTFRPQEVWNLTQGFITSTSERGNATVSVEVLEGSTQRSLWSAPGPTLTFR